jgi:hypothetical protein
VYGFVAAVTVGSRNTHYRAARCGLTRAALSPAGLHEQRMRKPVLEQIARNP